MNDFFEENKRPLLLMVLALLVFAVAIFLFFVKPVKDEAKREENNVENVQSNIKILETKLANLETEQADFDLDTEALLLEKKIPSERKESEYIIDLQRMEASTGAVIENITFSYDTALETEDIEEEEAAEDTAGSDDETATEDDETDDVEEEDTDEAEVDENEVSEATEQLISEMPEDIQAFTVTMMVYVREFDDFIQFIETVEQQERLSIVTRIALDQPTEKEELDPENIERPTFQVDVTSFYYPN